jgi:hypothetical protein
MGNLGVAALAVVVAGGWEVVMTGDMNGDHLADTVWYDPDTAQVTIWLMDGDQLLAQGPLLPGPSGEGWVALNVADADGDGLGDIIWGNADRNLLQVWLMDGTRAQAVGPEIQGPGAGWSGVTTADFDGDGMTDVLFRDLATGQMSVWTLCGTQVLGRGPITDGPTGGR